MKKLLLSILLCFVANAIKAEIASGNCGYDGDNVKWSLSDDYVLTLTGSGKMKYISSTSYVPWYKYKASISSVSISDQITSISNYAFYGCSAITSITIPNSVTQIGNYAFFQCSSITSITIPNSVTEIGKYAFDGCSSLKSFSIPGSVTTINDHTFYGCSSMSSVTIPSSVKTIGQYAFCDCSSLKSLTIPSSVTSIGDYAFTGCSENLTSISVISSNTKFDSRNSCNALINTITNKLILGCGNTVIPNTVTSIGYAAFRGSLYLQSITIPNSVTSIGDNAFEDCSFLKTVTISNSSSLTSIGGDAFCGCKNLTSINIPDGVTSIGLKAFYECINLKTVTISGSCALSSIGQYAFYGCSSLASITIPDAVTTIGQDVFNGCSSLTSITIPDAVTTIGQNAFYKCSSLTSITMPNSSSFESIGAAAFEYCTNLTSITIPNSITSLGERAFEECSSLTSITVPKGITSIGQCTFYNCKSLKSISLLGDIISIGGSAFWGCSSMTSFSMPSSSPLTSIGYEVFRNCISLTSIAIPNTVTSIGVGAFNGCTGLTSLTLPNSLITIEKMAFMYCNGLTTISIPSSVTSIGDYGFYTSTNNLTKVWCLGNVPPTIQSSTFNKSYFKGVVYVPKESVTTYKSADYWSNFNIQQFPETTLADGETFTQDESTEHNIINYTRTFNNTNWQALYIPFSMSYDDWKDDFEVAYINGVRQQDTDNDGVIDYEVMDVVKMTEGSLTPNHPYMIKAKTTGEKTITVNDATLYAAAQNSIDCSTTINKYTFTGTYETIPSATMLANNYYAMGSGTLHPCNSDLKPYRWYMNIEPRDSGAKLSSNITIGVNVIGEENQATGIKTYYSNSATDAQSYDLTGRKVNDSYKGIIIKNGKKYINR